MRRARGTVVVVAALLAALAPASSSHAQDAQWDARRPTPSIPAQAGTVGWGLERVGNTGGVPDHDPTIDEIVRSRPGSDRIIGGERAKPGQWPSMVAIFMRQPSGRSVSFCGGTIIDDTWVLTAAHCAAAMRKAGSQAAFFVREGTINIAGRAHADIEVTDIRHHPEYDAAQTLNDIALLKLARGASAPHQKLLARDAFAQTVAAPKPATVIGFGVTSEGGSASADLLQTNVPIMTQARCEQAYGTKRITTATFCAGSEEGGRDSCQGDSGGPIFRPGPTSEQVQVGVVSWGKGCGQSGYPGVYAAVGAFEPWLRSNVPGVSFVSARGSASSGTVAAVQQAATSLTAGAQTAAQPSALAQVTVDIVQGTTVRVGTYVDIRVLSSVTGKLALFNQDSDGRAYQIFPSRTMPVVEGSEGARIVGGRTLTIPPARLRDQGYRFRIRPPTGENKLIAMVLPDRAEIKDLLAPYADGSDIPDLRAVINKLVDRAEGSRGIEPVRIIPTDRAVAEREYQIVD